jgi:transcriptional/translational regulatory protein YebC/TACO1
MTDNRNRTAAEIRKLFEKHNGSMGAPGTAQWAFDRLGTVTLDGSVVTEDQLMEVAVEAGAEDYRNEGGSWIVMTSVEDFDRVTEALEQAGLPIQNSGVGFVPKAKKTLTGRDAEVCLNLAEALDDHDDVQSVYSDLDVSDEELERINAE